MGHLEIVCPWSVYFGLRRCGWNRVISVLAAEGCFLSVQDLPRKGQYTTLGKVSYLVGLRYEFVH